MYFPISYYLVLYTFYIQTVYSQVTLSRVDPESGTFVFFCKKTITLRCQYTGTSTCCNSSTRFWRKDGIQIMNDGVEDSTTGKYTEWIDATAKYFELTIWNIQESDFEVKYSCEYGFAASLKVQIFDESHLMCPLCLPCGFRCVAWGLLGIVVLPLILAVMTCFCCTLSDIEWRLILICGIISAISSLHLNNFIGFPVGFHLCICYDFSDPVYDPDDFKDPYFVFFIVGILFVVLFVKLYQKCTCKDCWIKEYHLWNVLGVLTLGIVYVYKRCKGEKANVGSIVQLMCPYNPSNGTIIWHKINDGKTVKYSEGTEKDENLSPDLKSRCNVVNGCHLSILCVKKSDAGTYQCSQSERACAVYRQQLTVGGFDWEEFLFWIGVVVSSCFIFPILFLIIYCCLKGDETSCLKKWMRFTFEHVGFVVLSILIFPILILSIYFLCLKVNSEIKIEKDGKLVPEKATTVNL